MTTDELLAAEKVRDMDREARAFLRGRLDGGTAAKRERDPRNRPPIDPPLPLHLAREHRQAL